MQYGFGVDVGGTTCKLGLFTDDGTLLEKWEIATDVTDGGKNILPNIAAAITDQMTERGMARGDVAGIGVGVPGAVRDGVVNRCVNLGWGVVEVERELSALTGLPVRAANDANIAALGEAWMGSGRDYRSIVMITLGTGVGGGVILDGKIWNGAHGAGGELGHIMVNPEETLRCGCGNCGCLEQYASATGVARIAKQRLARSNEWSVLRSADELTAREVFDAAKDGDALAFSVVREVCTLLGRAVATVCNVVDPEAVLIGGGMSRAGQIILDEMEDGFRSAAFPACRDTKILLASLGNDAGIYGGMRLVLDR